MKLLVEPVERGAHIVLLADAVVVFAVAQARSAKIEPKHRESKTVQRLHGMEHNFIVQRAAEHRMRMAHKSRTRGILSALVQNGFQTARWAVQKKRADCPGVGGHRD